MADKRFRDRVQRAWQTLTRGTGAVKKDVRMVGETATYGVRRVTGRLRSDRARAHGRAVKSRAASLLNAGIVILLLGVIGFSVYQVARHATVGLNTLRTQEIVDETYVELELFVFRDEAVLYCEGSNICHYAVRNGEKVGVGTTLGVAYAAGEGSTALTAADIQARLNAYGDRIALIESMGGTGTPADARDEAAAVDGDYLGLLAAAGRGDLAAVNGFSEDMLTGIGRYDILTGNTSGAGTVQALRAEQEALLSGLSPLATVTAERSGYFYYEADGYESVFPYASAMTMTPAAFREMVATPADSLPDGLPGGVVGKLVYDPTWYAAAYVPLSYTEAIELFQQGIRTGASYRMSCGGASGDTVLMKLERVEPDENGEGVLVVFSSRQMPPSLSSERTFRAETVARSISGYRIPTEALVTLPSDDGGEDVKGVYILSGGVVEFRKVRIMLSRDGYIIVDTYENVKAMEEAASSESGISTDGRSYLRLNDNIITGGNELYEGKVIH